MRVGQCPPLGEMGGYGVLCQGVVSGVVLDKSNTSVVLLQVTTGSVLLRGNTEVVSRSKRYTKCSYP